MKTYLAFLLVFLTAAAGLAATDLPSPGSQPAPDGQTEKPTPEAVLAAQVGEIASATSMSPQTRAKLIANAVRLAVLSVTEGVKDPAQRLQLALQLAAVAARAAPQFAEAITQAIAGIPSIAGIEGALIQVQTAVLAATEAAAEAGIATPAPTPPAIPANPVFGGNTGDTVVSPSN